MADPGFLPGLIGAAVAEILQRAIAAAEKAIEWPEYCYKLKNLLASVSPMVNDIISQEQRQDRANISPAVRNWLQDFHSCLQEAETVFMECADREKQWNPIARYKSACKLEATTARIKDLVEHQMAVATLGVVMQQTVAMDAALKDLSQQMVQLRLGLEAQSLGLEAQRCMQSEMQNKDRAFYAMKKGTERLTVAATGAINTQSVYSHSTSSSLESLGEASETQPLPEFVFGMEELNKHLQGLLLCSHDNNERQIGSSKWVGVWAKGGAGKTLLVQTAMNNPIVQAHFNGGVCLLQVGRDPNVLQLQQKLGAKIASRYMAFESAPEGKTKLHNLLAGKRCLLILDDVWNPSILDFFDVVSEAGSRILLTTRNQDVLLRVHASQLRVGSLSPENSKKLLCAHAFGNEDRMPDHLAQCVERVVGECKGLPLSLKLIGGALAGRADTLYWEYILQKLRDAVALNSEYEKELFDRLKLSYDDLESMDIKSRGRLFKECFLYFAAFPEDHNIQAEQLFRLWAGEGLTGHDQNMDPETEAYYVLAVLVGRSLVELEKAEWSNDQSAPLLTCQIHDVLRDLGLHIMQNPEEAWEHKCLFKAGWQPNGHETLPQGWLAGNNSIMQARKLSLIGSTVPSLPSNIGVKDAPLQVLLLSNNESLGKIDGAFLGCFTNLRVLDLSKTGITSLPKALGKLRELVTLSLQNSRVQSLPASIGRLTKLEHLNLHGCGQLHSVPSKGLSKLVSLKYFNTRGCANIWDKAADSSCNFIEQYRCAAGASASMASNTTSIFHRLEALGSLVQLRKLWISSTVQDALPSKAMSGLVRLRLLSVYFEKLKELPKELSTLTELETLDLNTCLSLEQLPSWVPNCLPRLKTLDLRSCRALRQVPDGISHLKMLTKLDLSDTRLQRLPDAFGHSGAFPTLEQLWLLGCHRLEAFPELLPGALSRLTILRLFDCASLKSLPESSKYLGPKLRHFDLGGCCLLALPSDQTFATFTELQELTLKNTPLSSLPGAVVSLPALQKLNISGCHQLESLPGSSDDGQSTSEGHSSRSPRSLYFPSLEELVAKKASIKIVPVSIIELPRLKLLDVTDCKSLVVTEDLRRAVASRSDLLIKGLAL